MEIFPFNGNGVGKEALVIFAMQKNLQKLEKCFSFGNSVLKYAKVVCLN